MVYVRSPHLPYLCLVSHKALTESFWFTRRTTRRVTSLQPNPQLGGPGDHTLPGLYPLTSSAWLALNQESKTPADIALWVTETRKPLHHGKVVIPLVWMLTIMYLAANVTKSLFHFSGTDLSDLQCMLQGDETHLWVAGHQNLMLEVDLKKGLVSNKVIHFSVQRAAL